jgi:hypothetical protein
VSLAGDGHVIVTVHTQLDRLLQLESRQRSALAEDAGVAFFAAKSTAHAPANHLDIVGCQIQGGSSFTLVAIRVLRGRIQSHLTVFTRHGVSDLDAAITASFTARDGLRATWAYRALVARNLVIDFIEEQKEVA